MRPLIEPNSSPEHGEIVELFLAHDIRHHETPATMWAPVTIWVAEEDCDRALEIATAVAARYSRVAREQWDKDWNERYHRSYARWLRARFRQPGNVVRFVLLLVMLGIFVVYPIVYVFRGNVP